VLPKVRRAGIVGYEKKIVEERRVYDPVEILSLLDGLGFLVIK